MSDRLRRGRNADCAAFREGVKSLPTENFEGTCIEVLDSVA